MREDLIGYLLSALDPHEMRRVEEQLRGDAELQGDLERLRRDLEPLDAAIANRPVVEVPAGLVSRTLASLPARSAAIDLASAPSVSLTPVADRSVARRSTWSDLMVAGLASVAVLGLLLPGVARGRYEARKIACQDHLRQLGTAITQFVTQDRNRSLPAIAETGPEAFAGMYAVRLSDSELLGDEDWLWCPEFELPQPPASDPLPMLVGGGSSDSRVRSSDLNEACSKGQVAALQWLQRTAGGHYAYTLGVVDDDHYEAPRYEARTSFAVLGDQPISGDDVASNVDTQRLRWGHGAGANLLFEDGGVRFIDMTKSLPFPDHPFFNQRGCIEAGVNIDDSSLAPSWRPPFINVRQR